MRIYGIDDTGQHVRLPQDTDEYFSCAAGRFAHIQKIIIKTDTAPVPEGRVIKGDFAYLRAFLEDHYNMLDVKINDCLRLFFPAYLYGFVEDTFARAIHHKIEGIGYALREVVGKYELRIWEYDNLFSKVIKTDAAVAEEAGRIALSRLTCPLQLSDIHREAYHTYIKEHDKEVLLALTNSSQSASDAEEAVAYLTKQRLLSKEAVSSILPALNDTAMAPVVAMLLTYQNSFPSKEGRGRLSLW